MKALLFTLLGCALLSTAAQASSDQAWSDHNTQMSQRCIAASGLKDAKAVGKPAEFDDRVGYSALLLEGRYPQKHMNNRKGSELCLFNKQDKTAFVTEWTPGTP
ncbi:hypothetical protein D3C77_92490 [compost metagenome]|uniref:hypothetical protein n=1 Tax=Pseudomonas TaxID=286 RepID=UPI000407437E|nr:MULTISPECIES: hypothetical protein [Pseudomonas]MCW2269776.1 hypothetical protein [Pseudomonas sp. JUb96]PRA58619.1 hypothetical protein CQ065_23150 [Pseudomonas sp. MYb187]